MAPIFEECNLANDHNQLIMDVMKRVARKHKFAILLHEKPFAGINGSGKHNNWSMATNTRITSYNVCYTKLLRVFKQLAQNWKENQQQMQQLQRQVGDKPTYDAFGDFVK